MQKSKMYLIIAIVLVVIIAAAFIVFFNGGVDNNNSKGPITIFDDDGTEVTISSVPQRIVSLAPSSTEVLFAIGAGDQVVGVTDFCDYPPNVPKGIAEGTITSIGNYWMPAIEPIIALEPDLVMAFGGGASDEAAAKLRSMGYTVIVLNPKNVNNVFDNIELVGKITGHTSEATKLVDNLQKRVDAITDKVAGITVKPKVYIEISDDPLMAVGPNSFLDDLVTLAGGTNIFYDAITPYPIISSDAVISKNPDIILLLYSDISGRPGWSSINAVANHKVYNQGSDSIYSRGGPRIIDALEEISKTMHPEIFGST
ncbi:MAG: cobalamin-binding protein [Candidatus Bathyarchaeota archaeon]|nr:cobalamin-binding protein [Candidatus Termiticorpusculum sp.]